MRKSIALILALLLCVGAALTCAAEGETVPTLPVMKEASYFCQGSVPMVQMQYADPENRTWIEVYMLKKGEAVPNMGTVEYNGEVYSVVGIQTIDPNDPDQYRLLEDGTTFLNTDLYLGDCGTPQPGEEVFLTVGLTNGDGEAIGELIPITVPEMNETATGIPPSAAGAQ